MKSRVKLEKIEREKTKTEEKRFSSFAAESDFTFISGGNDNPPGRKRGLLRRETLKKEEWRNSHPDGEARQNGHHFPIVRIRKARSAV